MHSLNEGQGPVVLWLWTMAGLVALMVIVGGATRLTDSGLSITEWQPLLGAIPPLTETQWLDAFAKYQQIPEYQIQNRGMSLDDFKFIYWWEWAHRFLGRFIGVAFALPLVWFVATGRVSRQHWPRLALVFLLGGLQGVLGWYMVSSGLSERVDVSPYRLSAHLTLAFLIFAAIVWMAMTINTRPRSKWQPGAMLACVLLPLLLVQIAAGGFVAGLDAGHASSTWPKMHGAWIPDGLWSLTPAWRNLFENALATQFNHRFLAYAVLILALVQAWSCRTRIAIMLLAAIVGQATLGVLTVLLQVPLWIALLHQGGALVVVALALWQLAVLIREPVPGRR